MKKKLILLCVLALLIAGLAVGASAAEGDPTLTVAANQTTVHPGKTASFTISLSNAPASGIVSIGADINVPTGLEFVSAEWSATANTFSNKSALANNFSLMNGSAVNLTGEVITLTYNVAADATGDLTITLSNPSGSDGDWGSLSPSNVNLNADKVTVDHTWETMHEAVVADCRHVAVDAYYTCSDPLCADKIYSATDKTLIEGGLSAITGTEKGPHKVNPTKVEEVLATCTEAGTIAHYTCDVEDCDEVFANATDTDPMETEADDFHPVALGHNLVAYREDEVKAATCTEDGLKQSYKCQREDCGKIFLTNDESVKYATEGVTEDSLTLSAEGHGFSKGFTLVEKKNPAFQVSGYEAHWICNDCYDEAKITKDDETQAVTADTNVYFLTSDSDTEDAPADISTTAVKSWLEDIFLEAINKFAGDVDDNKQVTLYDATMTFQYAAKNTAPAITKWFEGEGSVGSINGDVDGQNGITLYDATMIFQYAAKNPAAAIQQWFKDNPDYQEPTA